MRIVAAFHKGAVTAFLTGCLTGALVGTVAATPARAADPAPLLQQLADPEAPDADRLQSDILREWSKSGSPAMDLLLQRGQAAIESGDAEAAIEHLTALTDHAPGFAEGWNARATAFFLMGEFGPSLADIRQTLALNPAHWGALAGLGAILEETGRDDAAADAFRASLAINPHQPEVQEALDRILRATEGVEL